MTANNSTSTFCAWQAQCEYKHPRIFS